MDQARRQLAESRPRTLSDNEAVAIVSRWFAERNRELDHDHLHAPTPPEGWQDAVNGNEFSMSDASRRLGMNDIEAFAPLAARVLDAEGIMVDPSSRAYRTLLQLLARANKELAAIDLARLRGDFGYRPADPLMLAALDAPDAPVHIVRPAERRTCGKAVPTTHQILQNQRKSATVRSRRKRKFYKGLLNGLRLWSFPNPSVFVAQHIWEAAWLRFASGARIDEQPEGLRGLA